MRFDGIIWSAVIILQLLRFIHQTIRCWWQTWTSHLYCELIWRVLFFLKHQPSAIWMVRSPIWGNIASDYVWIQGQETLLAQVVRLLLVLGQVHAAWSLGLNLPTCMRTIRKFSREIWGHSMNLSRIQHRWLKKGLLRWTSGHWRSHVKGQWAVMGRMRMYHLSSIHWEC